MTKEFDIGRRKFIKNTSILVIAAALSGCADKVINTVSPKKEITATPESTPTSEATETSTATATKEVSKYNAEAVAFVPHSVEQIGQSVEVRSPITDPVGYKEDVEKVLKVIHEQILPNYSGDMLKAGGGQISESYDSHVIGFYDIDLNPTATMHFSWKDSNGKSYDVPVLFFPANDASGRFVYSVILDPVRDFINTGGNPDNPAPDWHMSEIIKRFPMSIKGNGSFETFYALHPKGDDEFAVAYFKAVNLILSGAGDEMGGAYWEMLGENGTFNRECEILSLISRGGQ